MPLSFFAGPCCLRLSTSIRTARQGASGWAIFLLFWLGLVPLNGPVIFAQSPEQTSSLGNAAKAHLRAERFLAGRSTAPSRNGQPTAPPDALHRARTAHAAMLQTRNARPAATIADLTAPWQPLGPVVVNSIAYGAI
ncbi:MAG: hypothetical protein ACRYFU_03385, partial [Janthinobacterium lividum]